MNSLTKAFRGIVTKLGRTITLVNYSEGGYDISTGQNTLTASTPVNVKASIVDASKMKLNLEVEIGDLVVTIRADKFTPDQSTQATINGRTYKTVDITELYSVEDLALYQIVLRRI